MSYELGNPWISRRAAGAALVCAAALLDPTIKSADAQPVMAGGLGDCAQFINKSPNHELEVCTAYMENSAGHVTLGVPIGARAPYYAYGRTSVDPIDGGAKHHFETRYWLKPRQAIEKRVEAWPEDVRTVHNKINLLKLASNLRANRALLRTRENWQVIDSNGRPRYTENGKIHNTTMCRVKLPSDPPFEIHLLHEWVVVKDSADPNFNCNAFALNVENGKIK